MNKLDQIRHFLYSREKNTNLSDILKNKRVILIGPAPYLEMVGDGELIDKFDIIIRLKSGYPIPSVLKSKIGSRTDIYYTNFKENQNYLTIPTYLQMIKENIKIIVFPYPRDFVYTHIPHNEKKLVELLRKNFTKAIMTLNKIPNYPIHIKSDSTPTYMINLNKLIGTRATTGILAILDLLQYDLKELHLTGFTFRSELIEQQRKIIVPGSDQITNVLNNVYSDYYKNDFSRERSWDKTIADGTHDLQKELNFFKILCQIDPRIIIDSIMKKKLN